MAFFFIVLLALIVLLVVLNAGRAPAEKADKSRRGDDEKGVAAEEYREKRGGFRGKSGR